MNTKALHSTEAKRMLMEADSVNLSIMYKALAIRNNSVDPFLEENVLIVDTAAD